MGKINQFKVVVLVVISGLIYFIPQSIVKNGIFLNPEEMGLIFSAISMLLILFIWALFIIFFKGFDE